MCLPRHACYNSAQRRRRFGYIGVAAGCYVLSLKLHNSASAVYASQSGYVMTDTSLAPGAPFFGERYGAWVWFGVAAIAFDVGLTSSHRAFPARFCIAAIVAQQLRRNSFAR